MSLVSGRTVYEKQARLWHPDLTPENDFQILALGSDQLESYTTAEKREWLQHEWASYVHACGSAEQAERDIKEFLDATASRSSWARWSRTPTRALSDVRY